MRSFSTFFRVGVLALGFFGPIRDCGASNPLDWPAFDNEFVNPMEAVAHMGTTLYVGGDFSFVGYATGGGVFFDGTSGTTLGGFPEFLGAVDTSIPDGAGGWFVGGLFTCAGGGPATNLAHVLPSGAVDNSWSVDFTGNSGVFSGSVNSLALSADGLTLFIGGNFYKVNSQARHEVAALNAANGALLPWNPSTDQRPGGTTWALTVLNGVVYVGQGNGQKNAFNGKTGNIGFLSAVDPASGAVSWSAGGNGDVFALASSGTTLFAGGSFSAIAVQPTTVFGGPPALAAFDTTSHSLLPFRPDADTSGIDEVFTLGVSGTTLYLGGYFGELDGQTRNNLAALNTGDASLLPWNPQPDSEVHALVVNGGTVWAGGDFASIGGQTRYFLASLDASTGAALPWDPEPNNSADWAAASGTTIFIGGSMSGLDSSIRSSAAAFDMVSGTLLPWDPDCDGSINALLTANGAVYAGGGFLTIGGQSVTDLAALDPSTGAALTSFNVPIDDGNGSLAGVMALASSGTTLYLSGGFQGVGGQSRSGLAAVDMGTGAVLPWNPSATGDLTYGPTAMAFANNVVYFAGSFDHVGGQPREELAAVDAASGTVLPWNPGAGLGFGGYIRGIAVSGNMVFVQGDFTYGGITGVRGVAALDAGTGAVYWIDTMDQEARGGLQASGGVLYTEGIFSQINGQSRSGLAALDAGTGTVLPWNHALDLKVDFPWGESMNLAGSTLYVAGLFTGVDCRAQEGFAALDAVANYTPLPTFTPMATPTPTSTPTSTSTPSLTSTPAMTGSPSPSFTPTPTPTVPSKGPVVASPNVLQGSRTWTIFQVPEPGATLAVGIYDVAGELMVSGAGAPGSSQCYWDSRGTANGLYLAQVTVKDADGSHRRQILKVLVEH